MTTELQHALGIDWDDDHIAESTPEFSVFLQDGLELWLTYVDAANHRIALSGDTWDALGSFQPAANLFNAQMKTLPQGIYRIDINVEPYATAVTNAAETYGIGQATDRITTLTAELQGSLTWATPADLPSLVFAYGQAERRLVELETELAQARALYEMVGDAIFDR